MWSYFKRKVGNIDATSIRPKVKVSPTGNIYKDDIAHLSGETTFISNSDL